MATTSAGRVQTAAVVQSRRVAVAEAGSVLWLRQASGADALAGWGGEFVGETVIGITDLEISKNIPMYIPSVAKSGTGI